MATPASSLGLWRSLVLTLQAMALAALMGSGATATAAAKWEPIDPQELADTQPQVDPEAGAEILLREVTINHADLDEFNRRYYVRAKIYSERGLEEFTKVELPYDNDTVIRDINVRTIKRDGTILELTRKDIYDREIIKVGRERVKVKAFSPAGLEPGAIVEYTYTEISEGWSWYIQMFFQSALPSRLVRFKFRPIDASALANTTVNQLIIRGMFLNCPPQAMVLDRNGYYPFEMRNVPAAKAEPNQPPALNCQSSGLLSYSLQKNLPPKLYWAKVGKDLHEQMLRETKATKLVGTTLASLIADGDSEEQKLRKLYDYCRARLVNRYSAAAQFTREQRKKFKVNKNASDTLKAGSGTSEDINAVFVALARAAGFDARLATCNNRSFMLFDASVTEPFMAYDLIAAVQLGGEWRFFDPGVRYLPFATPHWRNADTAAIIAAPKDAAPILVPAAPAANSQQIRKATFRLDADGTLEGDVVLEYAGDQESFRKFALDYKTPAERETYVREEVQVHLKLAEVTDIKIENAADPLAPLRISFHLVVPEYADRTGSRLFFQPAVFQKNVPRLFPEATRRTDMTFHPGYSHSDEIRIAMPDGFELEEGSSPASLSLGGLAEYQVAISHYRKTAALLYSRTFLVNGVAIGKGAYPKVRAAFDLIHERDGHTLTLKRATAAESPPAPSVDAEPVNGSPADSATPPAAML